MKINLLEKNVLEKFFLDKNMNIQNNFDSIISVSNRDYTGVGFFTNLDKNEVLRTPEDCERVWGKIGAKINDSIETGYLVYSENGYVTCIEGYTYGEEWPSKIIDFKFYKLP